ncbi:MAG TPA: DUF1330 domain-containing protein [Sporichthyaceae bacterium]|nr:DUF1330 domain-containing protein [Sporichthyaceae bacterium]
MSVYMIFHNRIDDHAKLQAYVEKAIPTLMAHQAEALVVDETSDELEGPNPYPRTVVLKFPSREIAMGWYNSPEYQAIRSMRLEATEGFAVICDEFVFPS